METQESENYALRPLMLNDFFGQDDIRQQIRMSISGAHSRNDVMGHSLFYGPPGLGKTTLARIVSNEMGGGFKSITGPSIQKPGDLASLLVSLQHGDVFFIDEIHRMPTAVEEILYIAMEDFRLDITTEGNQNVISLPLQKFTLIGATTLRGSISKPLVDRFDNSYNLKPYSDDEIAHITRRSAAMMGIDLIEGVDEDIAKRARNTPRIANKLLKMVRDYMSFHQIDKADKKTVTDTFDLYGIDEYGLDERDRKYLDCLRDRFDGGPAGLKTLAMALGDDENTVMNDIEPYLIHKGFIDKSPRGRILKKT